MGDEIKPGRYRHFKGREYEVLYNARHSETLEEMVVYRALYGEGGVWVRPAAMWNEAVERDGKTHVRFQYIENQPRQENGGISMLFLCYPKCTTCQRARKWLEDTGADFTVRDIKLDNPSADELRAWWKGSGLPLRRFFNTSGLSYKELKLKEKLPTMTEEEQLALLATDGMLVKRPILVRGDNKKSPTVLVGFRQAEWEAVLNG